MKRDPHRIGFKLHVILKYEYTGESVKYNILFMIGIPSRLKTRPKLGLTTVKMWIPNTIDNLRTDTENTEQG